ncbi:HSP20 family protein, partial [Phenoliferia sp. Uapishka_3]
MSYYYPFDSLLRLADLPESFFETPDGKNEQRQVATSQRKSQSVGFPKMDLIDNKDQLTCVVELPGLKKEDVNISLHDNVLSIAGKVSHVSESEGEGSSFKFSERSYGSFERKLAVPPSLKESEISAKLEDGLLKVTIPKKAKEAEPKKIAVN